MSKRTPTKGIEPQSRDLKLLADFLESRFMTIKQAARLFFDDKPEAAKKRLQKLRAAGWIKERPRHPNEPSLYCLTRLGYRLLRDEGLIEPRHDFSWLKIKKRQEISDFLLKHEIAVMDSKAAIVNAIRKMCTFELVEMCIVPERHAFKVATSFPDGHGSVRFKTITVRPDGFIHMRDLSDPANPRDRYLYLEVDRGTETHSRLLARARHFEQHFRKGESAAKLGGVKVETKCHPFKVVIAFTSAQRKGIAVKNFPSRRKLFHFISLPAMTEEIGEIFS